MNNKKKLLNEVTNTRNNSKDLDIDKYHFTKDKDLYILDDIVFSDREAYLLDDYQIELTSEELNESFVN